MRTCCLLLLVCCLTVPAWSQGQIAVGNRVTIYDIDAPVFDSDCATRLAGSAYRAQAYVGLTSDSLTPLGVSVTFRTEAAAGYIATYALTLPGVEAGTLVYFQLRAWEARAGDTYEAAFASGSKHGRSNVVPVIPTAPPATDGFPVGLQSFCLVPEPSSIALGVIGGGLLSLWAKRRRRKR